MKVSVNMAKKKLKKEEPRYNVQKQYEGEMKNNYYRMLTNMSKTILAATINFTKNANNTSTDTGTS